jgi:hypothetical protein
VARRGAFLALAPIVAFSFAGCGSDERATKTVTVVETRTETVTTPSTTGETTGASIRECGNRPLGGTWTYGEVQGAGDFNVTARNVSCATARAVVERVRFASKPPHEPHLAGWSCAYVSKQEEVADIRCTAGSNVVRWQTGS